MHAAVEEQSCATEHDATGHLCLHASTANHGSMRLNHGCSAHVGRTKDHKTTLCELLSEAGVISRSVDRAPGIPRHVDQIGRVKYQARRHGSRAIKGPANEGSDGAVAFDDDSRVVDLEDT